MRWDFVIPAWLDRLDADTELTQLLKGRNIFPASASRPVKIPSVEWIMIGDRPTEIFSEIQVQVDIFAKGTSAGGSVRLAGLIEKRIKQLTHHDVGQVVGGERMWLQHTDSRQVDFPSDPGVIHRILDFQFTPVRTYNGA